VVKALKDFIVYILHSHIIAYVPTVVSMVEIPFHSNHKKLINALWADRVNTKKSIGMSPFQLIYGVDTVFPSSLVVPVMKILQELDSETNDIKRRIN